MLQTKFGEFLKSYLSKTLECWSKYVSTASFVTFALAILSFVLTHGVRIGRRAAGNSLSRLYRRNRKV